MKLAQVTAVAAVMLLAAGGTVIGRCPQFISGRKVGTLKSSLIDETSGIAASRKNTGVLWVHNDSGDSARVFAISTAGSLLGIYNITGAGARDWEDIAIGPGPDPNKDYIYIGEIGDNKARHSSVVVYRVPEPTVDCGQGPVDVKVGPAVSIGLAYPDGPRDAETLMVDPITADIYIISKREMPSKVYRAAYPQSISQTTTMELVATLPWGWAVGGDISPDGNLVIVKNNSGASVWIRPAGANLWEAFANPQCSVPLIPEPRGEAICFDADGCGYFTVSEKLYQPIYYFARDEQCPEPAIISD